MRSELWANVHAERAALVEDLVVHLAATATLSLAKFASDLVVAGFRPNRIAEKQIDAGRQRSALHAVNALRSAIYATASPPQPTITRVIEIVVHGEDIRRPLQEKTLIHGLQLCATDADIAVGHGDRVEGPAVALLLVASGRGAAVDDPVLAPENRLRGQQIARQRGATITTFSTSNSGSAVRRSLARVENDGLLGQLHGDVIAIQATALAGGPDLDRQVPTCPGWTVTELLGHLWVVQTWVRSILRDREPQPTPDAGPSPVADFIDGIPDFLTAMRAINTDEPCWNFGPEPRKAGWWIRRQAHEHAIHRVDLEAAFGATPTFGAAFAADGVDEVVSMFYPRQLHLQRTAPVCETIRILAADTQDQWTLGDGDPVASVTADAQTLYLAMWKRGDLANGARIDGDSAAVRRTLGLALTP